jgi:hypothetical protein
MLIVALVLAVIGLASLVTAVVTSNEVVAWVCIAASALGVVLLIVDAIRERKAGRLGVLAAGAEDAEAEESAAPFIADADNTEIIESTEFGDATEVIEPADYSADVDSVSLADADDQFVSAEDHPEELVHDEPEYDMPSDDEPEYTASAEESAIHIVDEETAVAESDDIATVEVESDVIPDSKP